MSFHPSPYGSIELPDVIGQYRIDASRRPHERPDGVRFVRRPAPFRPESKQ